MRKSETGEGASYTCISRSPRRGNMTDMAGEDSQGRGGRRTWTVASWGRRSSDSRSHTGSFICQLGHMRVTRAFKFRLLSIVVAVLVNSPKHSECV